VRPGKSLCIFIIFGSNDLKITYNRDKHLTVMEVLFWTGAPRPTNTIACQLQKAAYWNASKG
jgi:hypothetical protein